MPPQDKAHRVAPGRPVERLGDRGAPVDDQRLQVVPRDAETPDVEHLHSGWGGNVRGQAVDPPEAKSLIPDIELFQACEARSHDHVTFLEVLRRAGPLRKDRAQAIASIPA